MGRGGGLNLLTEVAGHALGKIGFGLCEGGEIVAVVKAPILRVVEMCRVLAAPAGERYAAGSLSAVAGDGVRLDNRVSLEEFG